VLLGTYLGTHRELEKTHWALEENILGTLKAPKTPPPPIPYIYETSSCGILQKNCSM